MRVLYGSIANILKNGSINKNDYWVDGPNDVENTAGLDKPRNDLNTGDENILYFKYALIWKFFSQTLGKIFLAFRHVHVLHKFQCMKDMCLQNCYSNRNSDRSISD